MGNYTVRTRLRPDEAVERALAFFGEGGLGLTVERQEPCCLYLVGGGGHVQVTVKEGEKHTEVDLLTREWDYQVKQFMHEIA